MDRVLIILNTIIMPESQTVVYSDYGFMVSKLKRLGETHTFDRDSYNINFLKQN